MKSFLELVIFVPLEETTVKRKALIRHDTIVGIEKIDRSSCNLIIERRNGEVERFVAEETYNNLKYMLTNEKEPVALITAPKSKNE